MDSEKRNVDSTNIDTNIAFKELRASVVLVFESEPFGFKAFTCLAGFVVAISLEIGAKGLVYCWHRSVSSGSRDLILNRTTIYDPVNFLVWYTYCHSNRRGAFVNEKP
jgi:hypothetical protein